MVSVLSFSFSSKKPLEHEHLLRIFQTQVESIDKTDDETSEMSSISNREGDTETQDNEGNYCNDGSEPHRQS